ncbi:hypothetical protein LV84_00268 [Algoriphagus ratkowskyi]|uniref:Uncharacterized protein n=1 Tax=Algoriphagus ratkowskyi TaxID=57028 RepID=A0A2W7RRX2_9BACT|nr:hypothetical protein [Algoriphagus ratkowskyi]PZX61280.1 hypothetical protein LV84_00268 [Algoriphagus ratkowskyi]TXD79394.1 hypothetical protein ESW18_03960 [Algoriphagus ratkowskyi]
MDIQHFIITILSGMAGTIAMTLIIYIYAYISQNFTKVVHILGNMLVGERNFYTPTNNAFVVGTIAHFSVGILFSFAYFLLWNWGVFQIDLKDSILIGVTSGILAILVWKGYLSLHSNPPTFSHLHYFIALFIAHIVFAVVSVSVFQLITDSPELWYQLQDKAKLSI